MTKKNLKVCLITGAGKGIGKAIAVKLAEQGHHVIMACRDVEAAKRVQNKIVQSTGNPNIELVNLNLESLTSVNSLVQWLKSRGHGLDILINNAATFQSQLSFTNDGIEKQFAVNYLSAFYLTQCVKDLMLETRSPRIINIGSNMHRIGQVHFNDFSLANNYDGIKAYAQSKLALMLFTFEMARRFKMISCNCYHPGGIKTDIGNSNATGIYKYGWMLIKLFLLPAENGADTGVYLATSPEIEGTSGKYFYQRKMVSPARKTCDVNLGIRLWTESEKLIEQTFDKNNNGTVNNLASGKSLHSY